MFKNLNRALLRMGDKTRRKKGSTEPSAMIMVVIMSGLARKFTSALAGKAQVEINSFTEPASRVQN
jgi:hypothetical protein